MVVRSERGRVALVTGGSRGIGAATAVALAEAGWDVVISYRERADAAEQVVERCRATGRHALAVRADMAAGEDVKRLFGVVDDEFGALSALVNNAGIVGGTARVVDCSAAQLRTTFEVNVFAVFQACREAVRRMSTALGGTGGTIVNVSSRAAVLGAAGEYVHYAASKAAVDALTIGLAGEVGREGVRVVGVRPGLIGTDIHAAGRLQRLAPRTALGRAGTSEEVAAAIRWLLSAEAGYITGTSIDIAGGR